ncbi:threonine ammonia-lyase IlvA [Nocardioides sp. Kera G14]|uniref:threonine ammonia-lyase IlvA n=1 Tax=Nocardioides sp. Kera G14 TaxID=2884264 RepID=UPI001D117E26|nr:threonine ammonia-lyase IlvA [Nocardioides sp. Kera G14]UDY23375.1 threonine ammonia-lyase IlvA [Nocardioides sp. Kera G14]
MSVTPAGIAAAAEKTIARRTALERSERLSERSGAEVFLKREDQQLGRSYKVRGAFQLMSQLSPEELARGVVCASAGNHAQGVAISCARLGTKGHIFVPTNTPRQKRDRILALGGDAVTLTMVGSTYDEASAAAHAYARDIDATYVHAFDDGRTIAGQGTVGVEITDQATEIAGGPLDVLIVPVGGGGLLAGVATWVKSVWPECRIIGAEPVGAASMKAAVRAGGPVRLDNLDTFVDGASVGLVGAVPYEVARDLVDEIVEVPVGAICVEMLDLYQTEGIIAEPAGALASAAMAQVGDLVGKRVGVIVSGGNNDVSRYPDIVERAIVFQGLRHYFLVSFPQEPGALRGFLDHVLADGEDIVVFDYIKRSNRETGPALVGIDLESADRLAPLLERMAASQLIIEKIDNDSELFTFLR